MTQAIFDQDEIDLINSLERRVDALEVSLASRLVASGDIGAGAVKGGWDPVSGTADINHLIAGSVIAQNLYAGNLNAYKITAQNIATNSLTASVINVQDLSASAAFVDSLVANVGFITDLVASTAFINGLSANTAFINNIVTQTVDAIDLNAMWVNAAELTGGIITGATIQTAGPGGARVVMDTAGIRGYALDGTTPVFYINTATGLAGFTGVATLNPGSAVPGPALYNAQIGGGNMVPNSSFEQDLKPTDPTGNPLLNSLEGWQVAAATVAAVQTPTYHGNDSARLTSTGVGSWIGRRDTTADRLPVVPGRKYTISYWVRSSVARTAKAYYYFYKSDNTATSTLSTDNGVNVNGSPVSGSTIATSTTGWTRVTFTTPAAPSDAAYMGFLCHITTSVSGDLHYIDAIQVEQGDVPTSYAPKPDEIIYSSLKAIHIGAAEINATHLRAGSVSAQAINVSFPGQTININNGNFTLDAATGGSPTGWTQMSGNTGVVATDAVYGRAITFNNPTAAHSYVQQQVTLPKGRHVISAWCRTSSVVGTASGAYLGVGVASGTATGGTSTILTGTQDWTLLQVVATVTSASAVINVWLILGNTGGSNPTGQAWFTNANIQSSIGGTLITPNSISTTHLDVTTVRASILSANSISSSAMFVDGVVTARSLAVGITGTNLLAPHFTPNFESETVGSSPVPSGHNTVPVRFEISNMDYPQWHMNGGTTTYLVSGDTSHSGIKSLKIICPGTYAYEGISLNNIPGPDRNAAGTASVWRGGVKYTASVWARTASGTNPTGGLRLVFGETTNVTGSVAYNDNTAGANTMSATWTRYMVTWTPDVDKASATLRIRTENAVATTIYVDDIQIERGGDATAFTALGEGQISGTMIAGDAITTRHIAVSSITADKINFRVGGRNQLTNSSFLDWPAGDSPVGWQHYDNGGTGGTTTWSKSGPGPAIGNVNCWRIQTSAAVTAAKGFQTSYFVEIKPNTTYVYSFWWYSGSGNTGPAIASNSSFNLKAEWIEYPTPTNVWQRYSYRVRSSTGGWFSGINDFFYIFPGNGTNTLWVGAVDCYLAKPQFEEGDYPTEWKQAIDPTVIDGASITSATYRTNPSSTRVQIDDSAGLQVWNSGVMTAQMKAGLGGLDFASSTMDTTYVSEFSYDNPRTIRWLYSGNVVGFLGASRTTSNRSSVALTARGWTGSDIAASHLRALVSGQEAFLYAYAAPGYSDVSGYTTASGGRTIINNSSASSFMQHGASSSMNYGGSVKKTVWYGPFRLNIGSPLSPGAKVTHSIETNDTYSTEAHIMGSVNTDTGGYNYDAAISWYWAFDHANSNFTFTFRNNGSVNFWCDFTFWIVDSKLVEIPAGWYY